MRAPNPWVWIPSAVAGLIAGFIGWVVTDVSCRQEVAPGVVEGCPGLAAGVAVGSFLLAGLGMTVVLVLVYRSLAEYREAQEQGQEPPGPGCEV